VAYSGTDGTVGRYHCRGSQMNHGAERCISFGGLRVDRAIGAETIARLQPLGVEAALAAVEARGREHAEKLRQLELALEQTRYEAARARRQHEAVDPDNRLLAVRALEDEREALLVAPETSLSEADRERLLALGADLERAWESPGATPATRKRIIRTLIQEIVVRVRQETLDLVIHWQGGDHTPLQVKKNRTGEHRWSTSADVVDLVRVLARQMRDSTIAAVLNRAGKSTGRGNSWTRARVRSLRNQHVIAAYREGERAERGEVTRQSCHCTADQPIDGTPSDRRGNVACAAAMQRRAVGDQDVRPGALRGQAHRTSTAPSGVRHLAIRTEKSWYFKGVERWAA
jgi:hypothetical protein